MNRSTFLLLIAGGLVAGGARSGAAQPERQLTVFAASSLTDAFNAMGPDFERANPGVRVRFNYGASSLLRTQIEQGAPADVFASADYAQMQPLAAAKKVDAPRTCARNRLVTVVPAGNPGKVNRLQDLARPGLRVVTTAPTVPIGRYTQEVLEKLGRTHGFPPDFAARVNASVVSRETNVRGVLAKVTLGEADAAIVYETDARTTARVKLIRVPEAANVIAEYPIAAVTGTRAHAEAGAFVRYVLSSKGRGVLKKYGFR